MKSLKEVTIDDVRCNPEYKWKLLEQRRDWLRKVREQDKKVLNRIENIKYRANPDVKKRMKEYYANPDVKKKKKEYMKEYHKQRRAKKKEKQELTKR